jgi:hypothetical protein
MVGLSIPRFASGTDNLGERGGQAAGQQWSEGEGEKE